MGKTDYQDGFQLISQVQTSGLKYYPITASEAVTKGDALLLTSGYIALCTDLTDITFAGVAGGTNTTAEAVADGTIDCPTIPPYEWNQFIVPCEATDLITLAQVGICYDLEADHSIDEADTPTTYWGFYVDAIDVSTRAIAAETFGYAIGHFQLLANNA